MTEQTKKLLEAEAETLSSFSNLEESEANYIYHASVDDVHEHSFKKGFLAGAAAHARILSEAKDAETEKQGRLRCKHSITTYR